MTKQPQGRVLIIAGSDSGGGAGIQADIKTCAAFGAYSMTTITAITAQNTVGVQQVEVLSPALVRAQIESVMMDIGADVIKIGMLGNQAIVETVADALLEFGEDCFVVLDPVMVATSGDTLLEDAAIAALKDRLLPMADLITPNVPEAALLTGMTVDDVESMQKAGETLLEMGAYAALMKGGHLEGKSVLDMLVTGEGTNMMSSPRIRSRHTHGTGCTLASACAAAISLGIDMDEAVMSAREFVFEAIRTAPKFGKGNGPLNHGLADLSGEDEPTPDNPFAALKGLQT